MKNLTLRELKNFEFRTPLERALAELIFATGKTIAKKKSEASDLIRASEDESFATVAFSMDDYGDTCILLVSLDDTVDLEAEAREKFPLAEELIIADEVALSS